MVHEHDANLLRDNHGFLLVCEINREIGYDSPQYLIQHDDLENWFSQQSREIMRDTLKEYRADTKFRKIPELWFTYLSLKGEGVEHFNLAIKHKIRGVQEDYSASVINQISTIQEGDLIAFVGPGRGFPGRVDKNTWCRSFRGYFEKLRLYRITRSYFFDQTSISPVKGKLVGEVFPHRFGFDPRPITELGEIRVNRLSLTSKNDLHAMIYGNISEASPSTLLDLMYHATEQ